MLAIEEWRPNFKPQRDQVNKAMVWMRMPGLSIEYWERDIVLTIATNSGRPVEVDLCTAKLERGAFARVCVEAQLFVGKRVAENCVNDRLSLIHI